MRASRLLAIQLMLQARGCLTAEALAAQFEVSPRTIYRDIDALSAVGVPVYADRGPNGGFRLLDGHRTKLTGLTAPEAEALMLSGLAEAAGDLGLAGALGLAQLKLLGAITPEAAAAAQNMAQRVHVDPAHWYRRRRRPEHLPLIAGAVWRGERLRATYRSWRKTATRRLEPLGLVLKGDEWYLVASHHDRPATYRVDSFVAVEATGERFDPPAGFDLAASWRASVERFERDLFDGRATLRVRPDALDRIDELGAPAAEAIRRAPPEAGGARTVVVPMETAKRMAQALLGFGASIEALEPPELRAAILALASEAIAAYGSGPSRP